ncbi:MAG: hypothetical protein ABI782_11410 [Anaerolineaceae bacterium]
MRLMLEIEGGGEQEPLPHGGAGLCAFFSFAVSRGFGATHPLIALADRLHEQHHVRMGPLTTFYDGEIEDAEDRAKLELAWQDARGLGESLAALVAAMAGDEQSQVLARRGGAEELGEEAVALLAQVSTASGASRRVRMVYAL